MKLNSLILTLLLSFTALTAVQAQQIIAHRGYWKTDGSAQNSITALMKADSIRVYGSEVDFWISSDGVPVVNHDATVTLNNENDYTGYAFGHIEAGEALQRRDTANG